MKFFDSNGVPFLNSKAISTINNDEETICQYCGGKDCYTLKITEDNKYVKQYLQENGEFCCYECFTFMTKIGRQFTYLIHFMLKVKLFFYKKK
jgi:hypothetical protein